MMKKEVVFKWAIALFVFNLVLIALHLGLHYAEFNSELSVFVQKLVRRFSMDAESSIPTWFATSLLLTIGALAGGIGCKLQKKKHAYAKHWWLVSAIFVYLSLDEAAEIHELLIDPVRFALGIDSGPLFFAWIIPVVAVFALIGLLLLKFFIQLDKKLKIQLITAAIVFVGGSVGMEMISGAHWEANDFVYDMTYRVYNAIEEGLENTGSIIAIYALTTAYFTKKK